MAASTGAVGASPGESPADGTGGNGSGGGLSEAGRTVFRQRPGAASALAGGKALKYILIKVQLEFGINVLKDFVQHGFSFHEPNSSKNLLFLQYTMILAGGEEKNPRFWWKF